MNDTTSEGMDPQRHDDDRHPVRKILKTLPRVPARDNFEVQLRKRLAEQGGTAKAPRGKAFVPQRVPAYALSAMAVVVAGVVVYVSFIRTTSDQVVKPPEPVDVPLNQPQRQSPPSPSSGPEPSSRTVETKQLPEVQPQETLSTRVSIEKRTTAAPSPHAIQDELRGRGVFREIGGTGMRSEQPETSTMPFVRAGPNAALLLHDSIARADSAKRDSLERILQEDSLGNRDR